MSKKSRIAYDAAFKLKAVDLAIHYNSNRKAAIELGLSESMVRKWLKQREQLSSCNKSLKSFRGQRARWPELERDLEDWVNAQRADGQSVSSVQLRVKAQEMAGAKKIEGFNGGASWCCRFMKRKKLKPFTFLNLATKSRIAYDAAFKLRAVDLAIRYNSNGKAAIELGLCESMVRKWKKQQERLSRCNKSRKAFRGQRACWPELEKDLEDWVNAQKADGQNVSSVQLRLKAQEMAAAKKIEKFNGGASWCCRFLKRKNLKIAAETSNQGGGKTKTDLSQTETSVHSMIADSNFWLLTPCSTQKNPNILPQKFQFLTSAQFENKRIVNKKHVTESELLQPLASRCEVSSLTQCHCSCVEEKPHDQDALGLKIELKTEEDDQSDQMVTTETDMCTNRAEWKVEVNTDDGDNRTERKVEMNTDDGDNRTEWKVEVNTDDRDSETDAEELKNPALLIEVKHEVTEFSNDSMETAQQPLDLVNPEVNVKIETEKTDQHCPLLDKVKVKEENGADVCDGGPSHVRRNRCQQRMSMKTE